MAHEYYENIDKINRITPVSEGGVVVPRAAMEGVPQQLANIPPDEIVYAGPGSVVRDVETGQLTLDTYDMALGYPTMEWWVRQNPAVMRVVRVLGDKALDGYLVDCRRIGVFTYRDMDLENGPESQQFQRYRERAGTVFPLGALFNLGGFVEYVGHPELQDLAEDMMRRIDRYFSEAQISPHKYILPVPVLARLPAPRPLEPNTVKNAAEATATVQFLRPQTPLAIEAVPEREEPEE